jgi:SAM-dependent methyltransferase
MSGFSAEWLALREPADHAARDRDTMKALGAHLSGLNHATIVDIGCGTGSNLRATAPLLPVMAQSWTLVDYDPELLAAARSALATWADTVDERGEELVLTKAGKTISVDTRVIDLNVDVEIITGWRPDLVTAAAFFDLVSVPWITQFVAALARRKLPLYTVLTYDGRSIWTPPHATDEAINVAFHAHQATDKGFGPSAGPSATAILAQAFINAEYDVTLGDSPWMLRPQHDAELICNLADGIAAAASETGMISDTQIKLWRASHGADASALIGHLDLFATPKR